MGIPLAEDCHSMRWCLLSARRPLGSSIGRCLSQFVHHTQPRRFGFYRSQPNTRLYDSVRWPRILWVDEGFLPACQLAPLAHSAALTLFCRPIILPLPPAANLSASARLACKTIPVNVSISCVHTIQFLNTTCEAYTFLVAPSAARFTT